jgi:hypothetical protein
MKSKKSSVFFSRSLVAHLLSFFNVLHKRAEESNSPFLLLVVLLPLLLLLLPPD